MTSEEIYEKLKNDYSSTCINQVIMANEAGFDFTCLLNKNMPAQKLRDFRIFATKHLTPEYENNQLKELFYGYLAGLDVTQYSEPELDYKEMSVLKQALSLKLNTNLIKKYGINSLTGKMTVKDMKAILKGLQNKLTEEDFKKYTITQIELINKNISKDPNVKKYIDKNFTHSQIEELCNVSKGVNIADYLDRRYSLATYRSYRKIIKQINKEHNYEKYKILFNPRFTSFQIGRLYNISQKYENWKKIACPEYGLKMMDILIEAINNKKSEDEIQYLISLKHEPDWVLNDIVHYLEIHEYNKYMNKIEPNLLLHLNTEEEYKLASEYSIKDQKELFLLPIINENVLKILKYQPICAPILRKAYDIAKSHHILDEREFEYICKNIKNQNNLESYRELLKENICPYDINLNMPSKSIIFYIKLNNLGYTNIDRYKNISLKQQKYILKFAEEKRDISLYINPNNKNITYDMIKKLEDYNKTHENKINIKKISEINCEISEKGKLISDLVNPDKHIRLIAEQYIDKKYKEQTKEEER